MKFEQNHPQMNQLPSDAKLSSQQLEEISKKSFRAMFKNRNSKISDILQERMEDVFRQKKKIGKFPASSNLGCQFILYTTK